MPSSRTRTRAIAEPTTLGDPLSGRFDNPAVDAFLLTYEGYDPDEEGVREVLTSSGNGRFCSRGALEWQDAGGGHYPGTYAHGVYNRETTILGGVPVLNEDLVNLPNWLVLKLRIEGGDAISLDDVELLDYRHELDIRTAVTTRLVRFRDAAGHETTLRSRRFVSMAEPHLAAIEWTLTAHDWSGEVEVVSAIDGRVTNRGVERYLELEGRHLDPVSPRTFERDVIALTAETRQSGVSISAAARPGCWRAPMWFRRTERSSRQRTTSSRCSHSRLVIRHPSGSRSSSRYRLPVTAPLATRFQRPEGWPCAIRTSSRRWRNIGAHGMSCGASATCACAPIERCSSSCACTLRTSSRCARVIPPTSTPVYRRGGSTARRTGDTCSGMSSMSIRS